MAVSPIDCRLVTIPWYDGSPTVNHFTTRFVTN